MTRPDGEADTLGLSVIDEPMAKQSDPTVLDLQLRTLTKQTTVKPVVSELSYVLSVATLECGLPSFIYIKKSTSFTDDHKALGFKSYTYNYMYIYISF